jgi:ParB/RepB/Spo0J family partition protein
MKEITTINPLSISVRDGLERYRKDYGQLDELAQSILDNGQLMPILITRNHELVAGGRRLAACIKARVDVLCIYTDKLTDIELRELECEENFQRKDFTEAEKLLALKDLHEIKQKINGTAHAGQAGGWGTKDTAKTIGKSKATVIEDLALAAAIENHPELMKCNTKTEIKRAKKAIEKVAERADRAIEYEEKIKQKVDKFILNHGCGVEYMRSLPDGCMDILMADSPYGIDVYDKAIGLGGGAGRELTTAGYKYDDSVDRSVDILTDIINESVRLAKPTSHAYIFCAPEHFKLVCTLLEDAGWQPWVRPLIWIKQSTGQNNNPHLWPSSCYEMVIYARMPEAKLVIEGKPDWVQYPRIKDSERVHQAQKPVELLEDYISRVAKPGDVLVDPCMGSGASIEAAVNLKVFGYGSDIAEEAYNTAKERMANVK